MGDMSLAHIIFNKVSSISDNDWVIAEIVNIGILPKSVLYYVWYNWGLNVNKFRTRVVIANAVGVITEAVNQSEI